MNSRARFSHSRWTAWREAVRGWRRFAVPARLSPFYIGIFLVIGIHLPFWPLWLKARGMGAEEIGFLLGAGLLAKVVTNPVIIHFADRWGGKRRMLIALAASAFVAFSLFHWASGYWSLLAVTIPAIALFSAMIPLGENLTMTASYEKKLDYGRIRLWGSLAFILAAMGGGRLLVGRSEDFVLWMILAALGFAFFACLLMPGAAASETGSRGQPLRRLLKSPLFLLFLLAVSLLQAAHCAYYGFATLYWRGLGYSDDIIGVLWAVGVISEVVLFAFSGAVVARLGPTALIVIAGAAGVLRWLVSGLATDLFVLFAVQTLHALTFGATHLGAMHFIARAAPPDSSATAQSLYSSFAMGGALGLGMMLSGSLYESFGGAAAFLAMSVMALAGFVCALVLANRWRGGVLAI